MRTDNELRKYIPLTETSFYILVSLYEPLHGYAIMQKVEKMSQGRIIFGPGTLYGAINNLQSLGFIECLLQEPTNKNKKTFQITIRGKELIALEYDRLQEMVSHVSKLLCDQSNQGVSNQGVSNQGSR